MVDTLDVRLYGTRIGELGPLGGGRSLFSWSADAVERWGFNSTVLSNALPVGVPSPESTESFFGALLPEGHGLDVLTRTLGVAGHDLVAIFAQVGADLAGALQIGEASAARDPELLSESEIGALIDTATGFLVGGGGSALPGFQRKLTLTRAGDRWMRGNGTIPSTHILKPVPLEHRSAVEGEHYVLQISARLGLSSFATEVQEIAGRAVLIVERYDRTVDGGAVRRIHQEDAAQALGLPWGGNEKFENVDERANLRAVAAVLDRDRTVFDTSETDRERLLRYTALTVAVGNTDAHAKNVSILHSEDGVARLAPLYDASPLALGYDNGTALAMRIAGVGRLPDVTVDHLVDEASSWGVDPGAARRIVEETLTDVVEATRLVTAHDSIAAHVPGYIRGQAANLLAGRPARIESPVPLMLLPYLGTPQPRG